MLAVVLLLPGSLFAENAELAKVFKEYYEAGLADSPESATQAGRRDYNDRWTDYTPRARQAARQRRQDFLERLKAFDGVALSEQERLSVQLLRNQVEQGAEAERKIGSYMTINHFTGPHLVVPATLGLAPVETVKDFEDRIARLKALPKYVDGVIAAAEDAKSKGLLPPKLVVERMLQQLDMQRSAPAEKSPLLAAFAQLPAAVPAAEQERLRRQAAEAYGSAFQPAWAKLRDYVSSAYLPAARSSIGVSALPEGEARYATFVRIMTTTDLTPQQIHELGLKEVARVAAAMAAIRRELQFEGSHAAFVDQVLDAPAMRFRSEAEVLTHGRDIAKRADPELPRLFRTLPRMPYGVRAIPADRARTAAPYYEGPALDGSRAGNFYLRTVDPEKQSKCCMQALILHEAVPGHHLQVALAAEMALPEFRRMGRYIAYGEGWGLYAESLGTELGMYETPYERYGQLQSELFRSLRLVVDTGIHALGWSREKAIATLSQAQGGWMDAAFIASEVDRYIAMPAQALSYKVGELKIQELKKRAQSRLGAKFDIREFHDVILRSGPLPLSLLESEVNRWLEQPRP
ncbi:MAG: DUF885 domain-containing protein [Bryobacterales bacterium]|nr:DUF885 domain-containing protein [Bryobacterales bacterium]